MFIASTLHLTPKYIGQKYRFKNGNKTFFALKIGPKIENSVCLSLSLFLEAFHVFALKVESSVNRPGKQNKEKIEKVAKSENLHTGEN